MLIFVQSKDRAQQLYSELSCDCRIPAGVIKRGQRGRDPLGSVESVANRGGEPVPHGGHVGSDRYGPAGTRTGLSEPEYRG